MSSTAPKKEKGTYSKKPGVHPIRESDKFRQQSLILLRGGAGGGEGGGGLSVLNDPERCHVMESRMNQRQMDFPLESSWPSPQGTLLQLFETLYVGQFY